MADSIKPRHIGEHIWFYPTKCGLEFSVEHIENGQRVGITLFTLDRRRLATAAKAVTEQGRK